MTSPLRDGWGYDYATGKALDMRKPEERVRQDYERSLHLDYGYDLARMDIEVHIQRGERTGKRNAWNAPTSSSTGRPTPKSATSSATSSASWRPSGPTAPTECGNSSPI